MSTVADLLTHAPDAQILTDGYELELDDQGVYGNIRFWVPGSQLVGFSQVVGGLAQSFTYPGGTTATRIVPLQHPYAPRAYADHLVCKPPDGSKATTDNPLETPAMGLPVSIVFPDYFCDVHFKSPVYSFSGGTPMVRKSFSASLDGIQRENSCYHFPSDGMPLRSKANIPVGIIEFSWTFFNVSSYNESLFAGLAGCVNLTTFAGYPPGTVWFVGPNTDGEQTLGGVVSYQITLQFRYRAIPWNQVLRPDGLSFEAPVDNIGGGHPMIPIAELNNLWAM